MDKDKKPTPSEVKETALTVKKSGESPQMAVLSERLNLPSIVKPITPHVNLSNRYMSVTGTFGIGAFGFMVYTGYCFVTKRPWVRPLLVTAAFGAVYGVLDYKDNKLNAKAAMKGAPAKESSGKSNEEQPEKKEGSSNLQGISSEELFNRQPTERSKWIVDGYMKVGLINLLVAGSGVGKSILMMQIALATAKGVRPEFLPDTSCASVNLKVYYYRLEDFPDELEGKYDSGNVFKGFGITWYLPEDLPLFSLEGLLKHLKDLANKLTEDALVCIDPVTKFSPIKYYLFYQGVEEAMAIAKKRNVTMTIVVSAHIDEIKDWTVLTGCDIKGGDTGIQQAGSVTAIRRERTNFEQFRFLQSLKEPKGSPKPFNGDVLVCKKVEMLQENKYVHYEFEVIKPEAEALPLKPKAESDSSGKKSGVQPEIPKRRPNIEWTEEMEEKLKELYNDGNNDSHIATEMSQLFSLELKGTQIDRKLKKMGLRPPKPGVTKK